MDVGTFFVLLLILIVVTVRSSSMKLESRYDWVSFMECSIQDGILWFH